VLLTLSVFMDEAGRSCFPSIEDLIETTGLGRTAVIKHLAEAVAAGWLKKTEHGFRGRSWRRSEYVPCWPGREDTSGDSLAEERGGSPSEPPFEKEVVHVADAGGSPGELKVVRQVNRVRDQSIHQSNNSPGGAERAREISKSEWQELRAAAGEALDQRSRVLGDPKTPMRWLASGLDWRLDILAGVAGAAARAPPGKIRSWDYFTQAIPDCHAERTRPMPEGRKGRGHGQRAPRESTASIARKFIEFAEGHARDSEDPEAPLRRLSRA
jgi:hypothetical protein